MKNVYSLSKAIIRDDNLNFKSNKEKQRAMLDGCFYLSIPEDIDLDPGILFSKNFYLHKKPADELGDEEYRGFKNNENIYFPRDGYQTEHILIEQVGRDKLLPKKLNIMCEKMHAIARVILKYALNHSGINKNIWDEITNNITSNPRAGTQWFAANHYRTEIDNPGAPEHKDTGYVTVLYCETPGLEIFINNQWYEVSILRNSFIINFGVALELLTKNTSTPIRAVLHRVKKCKKEGMGNDRFSFAEFINPSANTDLYQVDKNGMVARKIISVEKFLAEFNKKTWSDKYENFGIVK